jgi:hypothetical protein
VPDPLSQQCHVCPLGADHRLKPYRETTGVHRQRKGTYEGAEVETWRSISESVISPRAMALRASHTTTPLPTSFCPA